MKKMLGVLVEAERCAVRTYTEICNMTFGKDHRTYDLALAILHEELSTKLGSQSILLKVRPVTSAVARQELRPTYDVSCPPTSLSESQLQASARAPSLTLGAACINGLSKTRFTG
jgi:hypothetical protein